MGVRVGIIPVPVFVVLASVIGYFISKGSLPGEVSMMIAVLAVAGFACGEIGKSLPVIRHLGAAAIIATFVPSYLVYRHLMPAAAVSTVTEFTKSTNFLYLFITAIIVGSIFGMDREVLIKGFLKIFVPIGVGTILAVSIGTAVGTALGLGARHTLFFIVLPTMAGGVGEGAIPLSTGYADILHGNQGEQFAQVLPPVMFGSLMAIVFAGLLNLAGKRRPSLTGNGRLQPSAEGTIDPLQVEGTARVDVLQVAAAGMTAVSLYLVGTMAYRAFGWPAPVVMLFIAVAVKLTRAVPRELQEGAHFVYRFFAVAVTYPLLFAIGVALTPWDRLVGAFAVANLITIAATVVTMTATGYLTARWLGMYPIDLAIVTSCRCGQGGTGDVAILTASERMELMPFAQVATRIGGALTVTGALIAFAWSAH
jgi:CCS family citrate carrier protein